MKEADSDDDECKFLDQLCQTGKKLAEVEDTINYCDINDFNGKNAVLIDLTANPERFTGYGGKQAGQIWSTIYQDNCFTLGETPANHWLKTHFTDLYQGSMPLLVLIYQKNT